MKKNHGRSRIRPLVHSDIPAAMALKEAAGWNQTPDDWAFFIQRTPEGCFAMEQDNRIIATSTAVPYGDRFGWVSMVLVDPEHRRQGHGTTMLLEAVSHLEKLGVTVALDATPAGKKVYDPCGFEEISRIERWIGMAPRTDQPFAPSCRPLEPGDMSVIASLDHECFGADRRDLLEENRRRAPSLAYVNQTTTTGIDGYILGRPGSRFTHLGPLVANDSRSALELLQTALRSLAGQLVGIDVPCLHTEVAEFLLRQGFAVERSLIRMVKTRRCAKSHEVKTRELSRETDLVPGGQPDRIFGITGPEWG